ncbi:hypothetical protein [Fumia xinanensis]|uniref:Uncharacterized protein n=1 Tax=Fumia xinanensis TaxID=2763659 RepID=A0A926E0W8_9FIRM|nr:hypothetical protein [Fumia xinanensis]MBC8559266.1 hypothetical protein [Fumia xinanensis]
MKITDGYDTINLNHAASFYTRIAKGLYWVPVNMLGKSRYTNEQLFFLTRSKSAQEVQNLKLNAYEALQLFQVIKKFSSDEDIVFWNDGQHNWELHKSGRFAFETNHGCCASAAAWFHYVLSRSYEQVGYLGYIRPDLSGHVMNYIYHNSHYYIIDPTTQVATNAVEVPVESGTFDIYRKAKLSTGVCYLAESLLDYANYHLRLQKIKSFTFSYYCLPGFECIPAHFLTHDNDVIHLYAPQPYQFILNTHIQFHHVPQVVFPTKYNKYSDRYF